jgi:hypothetical protein
MLNMTDSADDLSFTTATCFYFTSNKHAVAPAEFAGQYGM